MDETRIKDSLHLVIEILKDQQIVPGYGAPPSRDMDPRDFMPDFECCSKKEISAWKDACWRFRKGEKVEVPTHKWVKDGDAVYHIAHEPWGIGTYYYKDPEIVDAIAVMEWLMNQAYTVSK